MNQQPTPNNYQLKVCGLTKIDQILELISMNVDFLGFIFYEKSPRYVLNHLSLKQISLSLVNSILLSWVYSTLFKIATDT